MLSVDVNGLVGNIEVNVKFVNEGLVTVLLGRSGTGKTTLVNLISGLQKPRSGVICVGDVDFYNSNARINLPVRKRRVGYVFQEDRLFPHMSVKRNLTFANWACGRKPDSSLDEIVSLLGLEKLLSRAPLNLSGGEKQRVAIGRALLSQPRLLVMDEPLASLDNTRKAEILPYLERLCKKTGIPIVYVSHALEEVIRLGDYIVVLSDGKVEASGPAGEILAQLDLGPFTDRFETSSMLNAKVVGSDEKWQLTILEVEGQRIEIPEIQHIGEETVHVRVLARDVSLALLKPEGLSIRNQLEGTVKDIRLEEGPLAEIMCSVGEQLIRVRLTKVSVSEMNLNIGSEVFVLIKSASLDDPYGKSQN